MGCARSLVTKSWLFSLLVFAWVAICRSKDQVKGDVFGGVSKQFVVVNSVITVVLVALFLATGLVASPAARKTLAVLGSVTLAIVAISLAVGFLVFGLRLTRELSKDFKSK